MTFTKKRWTWRLFYAVCSLVYMGWVSYLGFNDFDRIRREYRRAADQVEPGRIHSAALQELLAECRQRSEMQAGAENATGNELPNTLIEEGIPADRECHSWPPAVVETREAEIREPLLERQKRAGWKLVWFSVFFVVIFLISPPAVIYLFAVLITKLFSSIKIVRK